MIALQIYEISPPDMAMRMCSAISSSRKENYTIGDPGSVTGARYVNSLPPVRHPDCVHALNSSTPQQNCKVIPTALRLPGLGSVRSGTQTLVGKTWPELSWHLRRESDYDSVCWHGHLPICKDTIRRARMVSSSKCCDQQYEHRPSLC